MLLMLGLLALAAPVSALDPARPTSIQAASDPVAELRAELDALPKNPKQPGYDKKALDDKRTDLARRARALMEADPRGELAVRVRVWMVTSGVELGASDALLDELLTKDVASPALGDLLDILRPSSRPDARVRVETLVEKAGDRSVRGLALRTLADHVKYDLDGVRSLENGDISVEIHTRRHGAERAEMLRKTGTAGLEQQYVALLERVVKDFGDVRDSRGRAIGPRAEGALFEFQQLSIGKIAPDIEAEDIHGTTFKLSDYRGKVVVLDFWGHW